jgi:hypothetical protein
MIFVKLDSDGTNRNNIINKVLNKVLRRIFEFPDIELMFRIPQIVKMEVNTDLLISIAMPYPIHWGCALSKSISKNTFPKIWAADCGDPYMGTQGKWLKKFFYFKYVEKWFCRKVDHLVVPIEGAKDGYYPEFRSKIKVIPQGFRFDNINICLNNPQHSIPTFAYSGTFYKEIRDPSLFLEYLSSKNINFKFIIYTTDLEFLKPIIKDLGNKIEIREYIPRDQLLYDLSTMDFLVNFENETLLQSPSKLIDYALAKRPILSIPSNSLPENTIDEFLAGIYQNQFIVQNVEQYNISNVAKQFSLLIC